jgi:predicted nucleic acid-binding protein
MIILDTNVISEVMRPVAAAAVVRWWTGEDARELHVTAITMAEILYGIEILPAGARRSNLHAGAERIFGVVFADRVIPFDEGAARTFALIVASRRKQGTPISKFDAQIAAIARAHGATLATRNTSDFEGCGVRVVNPWEG